MKNKTLLFLCVLLMAASAAFAQMPALPPAVQKAANAAASSLIGPPAPPPRDALGRATPKSMIEGFLNAVGDENYEKAAQYLDLSRLSSAHQKSRGPELARDLQTLLDQGGWVAGTSKLSDLPNGDPDDGLDPKIDRVGTIKAREEFIDLLAEQYDDAKAGPIWRISKDTVDNVPALLEKMSVGLIDRLLPSVLIEHKWSGVPLGHWAAIIVVALLSLSASWLLTFGVLKMIRAVWPATRTGYGAHALDVFELPIRLYIAVGVFAGLVRAVGISIVARQDFGLIAEVVGWLSLLWLLWRIIDIVTESTQEHMSREKRRSALSAVVFFRRTARFILAAVAVAVAMERMGLDITAGIAALGLGGLALAFGARQVLEHFMSSLILIIEQPVRIGDFCKAGNIKGRVEDIGMRSTRLLTQDQTMITIPNATFAAMTIENFALRQRFLFHPVLALNYETTPEQIKKLLEKIRAVLATHPRILADPAAYARFTGFGSDGLNVEVGAYVSAQRHEDYLEVQEDLMLRIMEAAHETGCALLPTAVKV